jgi:hypothetical protein
MKARDETGKRDSRIDQNATATFTCYEIFLCLLLT